MSRELRTSDIGEEGNLCEEIRRSEGRDSV